MARNVIIKYAKKLKRKMFSCYNAETCTTSCPVYCDELFRKTATSYRTDDPVLLAYITAQKNFRIQPNRFM